MENNQETNFIIAGDTKRISILFTDGMREIPEYIVEYLGADNLKQSASAFADVTFSDFMEAMQEKIYKDELNNFQNDFVTSHFNLNV